MIDHIGITTNDSNITAVFRTFEIRLNKTIIISRHYEEHDNQVLCIINEEVQTNLPNISNVWKAEVDEGYNVIAHSPTCLQITLNQVGDDAIAIAFRQFCNMRIIIGKGENKKIITKKEISDKKEEIRNRIYKQILGNVDSEKISILASYKIVKAQLEIAKENVINLSKRVEQSNIRLKEIEELPEGEEREAMIDTAVSGIMRLYESGAYANIEFTLDSMNGLTPVIWIEHEGLYYQMGTYLVKIPYNNTGVTIHRVWKPEGAVDGYYHPHITTSGSPCLGNIGKMTKDLLSKARYAYLFTLLKEYLLNYNPKSPYHTIEHWKSYTKEEYEQLTNKESENVDNATE